MGLFFCKALRRLALVCVGLSLFAAAAAGRGKAAYEVKYKDSVRLEEGSRILSTLLYFRNPGSAPLHLGVRFQLPPNWKPLGQLDTAAFNTLSIDPGAVNNVSINLLRAQGVAAGWNQIKVLVVPPAAASDTVVYTIHLYVPEKPAFHLTTENPENFFAGETPDSVRLLLKIKNTGNIPDTFRVTGSSSGLSFQYKNRFVLQPGQDTTLSSALKIKQRDWREFNAETIPLLVTSAFSGKQQQAYFKLRKVSSLLTLPPPARKEIPITFGGGGLLIGDRWSYFGQFSTSFQVGQHYLGFSYRSKDLGDVINSYQQNAFNLTYSYKNLQILAGQIPNPKNFYTFGQGASIRYRQGNNTFSIAAIKHNEQYQGFVNRFYVSDNIYAAADYRVKKVLVSQQLEANFNDVFGLNSYLFHNEVTVLATPKTRLHFFGGLGLEHKTRATAGIEPNTYGWAGGYEFFSNIRRWRITSVIRYRSSAYPGIFQGLHYQQHEAFREIGRFFVGPAFYYNGVERNTLRDTLYNTDFLTINSLKLGLTGGYSSARLTATIGVGELRQLGQQYSYGAARYADLGLTAKLFGKTELRITANNAFVPADQKTIFSTNTQMQVSGNRLGFNGFYNRLPHVTEGNVRLYETITGGPVYNQTFFNRALFVSFRYSLAKTLSEESIRHGIGGQINFSGVAGIQLGISGFYPLQDPTRLDLPITETRSGSVSLTKRIGIRTAKKADFDLKVVLFIDANNNRVCDEGEARMPDALFSLENEMLLTDKEGTAKCRHLRAGLVRLSFLTTKTAGLVPVAGVVQTVALQENTTAYVAFKEGKKITGKVQIQNDSMSHYAMTPDNLKIVITDTFGTNYYALTDKAGFFYCFVPEGSYQVALNADIFEGTAFTPEQARFTVDMKNQKEAGVIFKIIQKKRKIRFLK